MVTGLGVVGVDIVSVVPLALNLSLLVGVSVISRRLGRTPRERAPDFDDEAFTTDVDGLGARLSAAVTVLTRYDPAASGDPPDDEGDEVPLVARGRDDA